MIKLNKDLILKKLEECNLDKDRIIVISGASLVIQGIIKETSDIDLSCAKDYYDKLDWNTKTGAFGIEIKYHDVFEISNNLYFEDSVVYLNGYKFMNLAKCLEIKKELNRLKDKETIKLIEDHLKESNKNERK